MTEKRDDRRPMSSVASCLCPSISRGVNKLKELSYAERIHAPAPLLHVGNPGIFSLLLSLKGSSFEVAGGDRKVGWRTRMEGGNDADDEVVVEDKKLASWMRRMIGSAASE